MIRTRNTRRGGFTLVELLVGISIFLALAGLTLLLYPGARDQDRVRYTVSDISAHLRMSQSMAARDKAPRGIRFVVNTNDPNTDKTDPRWATELQFIEQPPPLIPNRNPLGTDNTEAEPRVRFQYEVSDGTNPDRFGRPAQSAGTVVYRQCVIENLQADQAALIQPGCTLVLPVFGFWAKISSVPPTQSMPPATPPTNPNPVTRGSPAVAARDLEVTLEVYPDAIMGGSTHNLAHHFAVYLNATPLVGEPTVPLPKNICVDLNVSVPNRRNSTADLDVLFGPDGKLVGASSGKIFLWVRDFTKPAPYSTVTGPPYSFNWLAGNPLTDALRKGGEQQIIAIRSSGAIASNNVAWPANNSNYIPVETEPYILARDLGR